jgi:uncharacterized protein YjbI with pentapeptide repeats
MEIINETPFQFAPLVGRLGFPEYSLSIIIKGTFDLVADGTAVLSEEQKYPTGDEFYPDEEEERAGSCRYESDFTYFKPQTDLLLAGHCHPPRGKSRQGCMVTFQVGNRKKRLAVFGNRYWGRLGQFITDPEPFTSIELKYENSYGGEGFDKNPVGKGIPKSSEDKESKKQPLPNIENPDRLITTPDSQPEPAGFGPLGKMWWSRMTRFGSYSQEWFEKGWPWFPLDFDWAFFNAAPQDMQLKGYLRGDEKLYFENLHLQYSRYFSRLPALRVRCFANVGMEGNDKDNFKEIKLNLDTLWVDMDVEQLILVWRGVIAISSDEYLEIRHMYVVREEMGDEPHPVEFYFEKFTEQVYGESADPAKEIFEAMERERSESEILLAESEKMVAEAELEVNQALADAGLDKDHGFPIPTEENRKLEKEILKEMGLEEMLPPLPLTRECIMERLAKGESLAGENITGIDLSGMDMQGADLRGAILQDVNLAGTWLQESVMDRAVLSNANLAGSNLHQASLRKVDLSKADLRDADLTDANLDDALIEEANLKGASLDRISGVGTIFTGSDLTGAAIEDACLDLADFSQCILEKTCFNRASLREACLESAQGLGVSMEGADLTELRASEGCNFSSGNFRNVIGSSSVWEGANLQGADFSYANMDSSDFTKANLEQAIFYAADMAHADFSKANLRKARCVTMNLFQGSFAKANLTDCDFSGSNLYEVEFLEARIENIRVIGTNLKMTKLDRGIA